jgi:hypothetical protein
LCLAAQADTFADARTKLENQVADYVYEALTIDRAYAWQLLNRKAPLRNRIEYYAIRTLQWLTHRPENTGRTFEELVSIPATA